MNKIFNHQTASLSEIDLKMIKSVPSGGNWKNIPKSIPSERLKRIRRSGGRTFKKENQSKRKNTR